MLTPERRAFLSRWQEVLVAGGIILAGLWIATRGGLILGPAGALVMALGAGLGWQALRRLRFTRAAGGAGIIEVDEAQIAFMGPETGGFVSVRELVEIRLIRVGGRHSWRLKQADGQALLIPLGAAGSAALHDAFATLPGIDMGALLAAIEAAGAEAVAEPGLAPPLWRRPVSQAGAPRLH